MNFQNRCKTITLYKAMAGTDKLTFTRNREVQFQQLLDYNFGDYVSANKKCAAFDL